MEPRRVACFIDGFNLYHAIADLRQSYLKWIDLWALASRVVKPQSEALVAVYYFSADTFYRRSFTTPRATL